MKTILISLTLLISVIYAKPNYYGSSRNYHHGSAYTQSTLSSPSSSSALSPWAQEHMDEIQRLAERMRNEFNSQSYGGRSVPSSSASYSSSSSSSSYNFPRFTGKSQNELDLLAKQMTQQMIDDMKSGRLQYSQILQPHWFENHAALKLEALEHEVGDNDDLLQQQSQSVFDMNFEPQVPANNYKADVENLNFDEISHVTYPPSVSVHGGRTYVTRKNCTTVTTANGGGSVPVYSGSYFNSRNTTHQERVTNYPGPVVIPVVDDTQIKRDTISDDVQKIYYPEYNFTGVMSGSNYEGFGVGNQVVNVQAPGHRAKITISHRNRTITGTPGHEYVTGCRGTTVIVNGNVVYNYSQPIGAGSTSCVPSYYEEAEWKRKEREHLFWLLAQRSLTSEDDLQRWQQQNWEKLTQLAQEYRTTVEEIKEFQRSELKNYFSALNMYPSISSDYYEDWKRKEKARWDWLIQQNRINEEELARWQMQNRGKLIELAQLYSISIDELENWQKNELSRIRNLISEQNEEIAKLRQWQMDVQNRLQGLMYQHNITIEQLREKIHEDLTNLEMLSRQYHINTEEIRKWLEAEQIRIMEMHQTPKPEIVENWQIKERYRLEQIIRQFNLSMDEINERLNRDHSYLIDLANQYHISIEKLKEWQRQEIIRLQNEGRLQQARLEAWQQQLQDQLKAMIREHELTISELEEIIKRDHQRLQNLAEQYRISIEQIQQWYLNEARRLFDAWKVENLTKDWKWSERQRIDDIVKQHNYTVEELRQRLIYDRQHLENLARYYNLQIQELQNWYEAEIKRLQDVGLIKIRIDTMDNWQREEDNYIRNLIRNRDFTIEDLEERLRNDYEHLLRLSQQYRISQQQILEWYKQEIEHLFQSNLIKQSESLTEWQIKEKEYINEIIKNHQFTVEDLVKRLEFDRKHLEELQKQYNLQFNEIIEWYRKQADSLVNRGLIKEMENLENWQIQQRQYIYELIRNQEITIKDLQERLLQNQDYLNRLSQELHISINQLKEWYEKEIQRLINQGFFESMSSIKTWQTSEIDRIMNLARNQTLNYEDIKKMILQDREYLLMIAQQYNTNIQEIENWYLNELSRLHNEGILKDITEWQIFVRNRLEDLIRDYRWSIEELQERFQKNQDELHNLLRRYHITMEQLIEWYNKELERLYQQDKIYRKSLQSWHTLEEIFLQNFIKQHGNSLKQIHLMLLNNEKLLREIANRYQITIEELKEWYKKIINDFITKGLIINDLRVDEGEWKEKERQRLEFILMQSRMSYDEFVDFLRDDFSYHYNVLISSYGIDMKQLTEYQLELLQNWYRTGKLKKLELIKLEDWQKKQREYLYDVMIKQYEITRDRLPSFQKMNHDKLEELAQQYGIDAQVLVDWQRKELQRLYELGLYYNMTIKELQEFREAELLRITNAAHFITLGHEFRIWETNEHLRIEKLRKDYNFTDEQLWSWRRRLFLYCQGLLHLKPECVYALQRIDGDRGDQPPQMMANECEDNFEPGLLDPNRLPQPKPPRPNLPYQTPLAPFPNTRIYEYQRNKTERIEMGPNIHRTGHENTREYLEESRGSRGGWHSSSSYGTHNTRPNHYGAGDVQRQEPIRINFNMPSAANVEDNNEYLSDQQQMEDLTQQSEDFGQQKQDMKANLEDLDQQRIQRQQFPPQNEQETEDLGQQVVQKPEFPTAKEIQDLTRQGIKTRPRTAYSSNPKIYPNEDEHPAKVEEFNPNLEVEAVQVTEKPSFFKKIFG